MLYQLSYFRKNAPYQSFPLYRQQTSGSLSNPLFIRTTLIGPSLFKERDSLMRPFV